MATNSDAGFTEVCPDCGRAQDDAEPQCDFVLGDGDCRVLTIARLRSELEALRGASAKPCADCGGTGKTTKGLQGWTLPCASCATPQPKPSAAVALSTDERSELSKLRLLVDALEWLPECTLSFTEVDSFLEEVREMGWVPPAEPQQQPSAPAPRPERPSAYHEQLIAVAAAAQAMYPHARTGLLNDELSRLDMIPLAQKQSAPASRPWVAVESGVMPEDDVPIWVIVARRPLPVASERDGNWIDITGGYWLEQVPLDDLLYWMPRHIEPTPAPPSDSADGREP